jgi:hypothetical protein
MKISVVENKNVVPFLLLWSLFHGCFMKKEVDRDMTIKQLLESVHNDRIQFATMQPPDSKFVTLDRRVVVTGSPELVTLSRTGDPSVLDELVKLLREPDRAWAAQVLLAAMTRREEKMVDVFARTPEEWWNSVGKTAHQRWSQWLQEKKGKLIWNSENKVFSESDQ